MFPVLHQGRDRDPESDPGASESDREHADVEAGHCDVVWTLFVVVIDLLVESIIDVTACIVQGKKGHAFFGILIRSV